MLDKAKNQEDVQDYGAVINHQAGLIFAYEKENKYYKCTFSRGALGPKIGLSAKKAEGHMLHDLFSRDELDYITPYLDEAWQGHAVHFKGVSSDGAVHYLAHLQPIAEEGRVQQVVATFSDVTNFMNHMKESEEFDREKSSFWRNVNSEIRTPMNSVSGILSLLVDTHLDESQRNYVNIIQESFNNLIHTFDELLSFSKLETEGAKLESQDFNFKELIGSVIESLNIQADKKNIDFNLSYDEAMPTMVMGDQGRFRQLVHNFTHSILSVTPDDGVIDINVGAKSTGFDGSLKYDVAFSTLDKKTGKDHNLDLKEMSSIQFAVALHLVKVMRGTVSEEKVEGKQRVSFDVEMMKASEKSEAAAKLGPTGKLSGVDVLYVVKQDNQGKDPAIEELKKEGAHIVYQYSEHNIVDALQKNARAERPYKFLVIEDDAIEMSALELVREIKSKPDIAKTNILALLPKVKQKQERIFLKYGASAVVIRPIAQDTLLRLMLDAGVPPKKGADKKAGPEIPDLNIKLWADILIAEDNKVNRMMAEKVLEKMGCTVTSVENGKEAFLAAQEKNFDLILMDCQMPEMDGYEASRAIKQLVEEGAMPNLPIIALTAQTAKEDRERCIKAGMDNYLSKPVSLTRLKEVLQMYLRHRMVQQG